MSQAVTPHRHPLVRAVEGVRELLDDVAGANPVFLTTEDKQEVLTALVRERARLEALELRVLAAADDVAEQHGTRHAGAWLAHQTRQDAPAGRRAQRLADGLDQRWPHMAEAYAAGEVSTAQVAVIGRALDNLPADVDPEVRAQAEEHLVAQAKDFAPKELRRLGRRVLEVIAPEVAEAHEAKLLEKEERAAHDQMALTWRRLGGGLAKATVTLPDGVMDRWLTHLHAFTSPRRHGHVPPDERIPYPRQLAHAFQALLERIPSDWLPRHGGGNTTLITLIDHEKLTQDLAVAELATGTHLTAGETRRLACNAGIIPAVLGGKSRVLDLGSTRRFFDRSQRMAMMISDRECRTEGCEVPAAWCEAHHLKAWGKGGPTDLEDGVLLCSFHHHRAHDTRYDMTRMTTGDYRFHRRT